jgi:hypothetical protein
MKRGFFTTLERHYWGETQIKLLNFITKLTQDKNIPAEEKMILHGNVHNFCHQGSGYQRTLYKFLEFQFLKFTELYKGRNELEKYEKFTESMAFICRYLDQHYLKHHPKHKKQIKNIEDLSKWYWDKH